MKKTAKKNPSSKPICITPRQYTYHVTTEMLSVVVSVPILLMAAQKAKTERQRKDLRKMAGVVAVVDTAFLMKWAGWF